MTWLKSISFQLSETAIKFVQICKSPGRFY
jgi:hypothetical protein